MLSYGVSKGLFLVSPVILFPKKQDKTAKQLRQEKVLNPIFSEI
jgi:hypothetical protein